MSDPNGMVPEYVGSYAGGIVARTENNDSGLRNSVQQNREISVRRNEDEIARRRILKDLEISLPGESISKCALGARE